MNNSNSPTGDEAIAATSKWLDRAVIGLNLCPFAKSVQVKKQVRYVVSAATDSDALLADLERELHYLAAVSPEETDTTLLIHPYVLTDFDDFTDFLDIVDVVVRTQGLAGNLQVANFHPDYCFSDADPDDIGNYTNRAPYPTLHLIREASIDRAVAACPDASRIYERNIETLERIGREGWRALDVDAPKKSGEQGLPNKQGVDVKPDLKPDVKQITPATLQELARQAQGSPRRRANHNLHAQLDDPVQRLAIAMEPGTYVRPHRHPQTWELLYPLAGRFIVLHFDSAGFVSARTVLGEQASLIETPSGGWHAVLSLDSGGVIFEVKHGPYQPIAEADHAPWSPAAETADAARLNDWYASAQVGERWPG